MSGETAAEGPTPRVFPWAGVVRFLMMAQRREASRLGCGGSRAVLVDQPPYLIIRKGLSRSEPGMEGEAHTRRGKSA